MTVMVMLDMATVLIMVYYMNTIIMDIIVIMLTLKYVMLMKLLPIMWNMSNEIVITINSR